MPQILVTSSNGRAPRQITSEHNKVDLGSINRSPDVKTIACFARDRTINLSGYCAPVLGKTMNW